MLWIVQGIVMLVFIVPLQRISQLMSRASWWIIKWVYYKGIVLTRRRLTGRPLWSDTDLQIGAQPPPDELERLMREKR